LPLPASPIREARLQPDRTRDSRSATLANHLSKLVESYRLATKQPPPPGYILVHNRPDPRGFRAWWATPGAEFVPCDCGWRPDLGEVYRVDRPVSLTQRMRRGRRRVA
jgi:hypothetical protein